MQTPQRRPLNAQNNVARYLEGATVRKEVVVPGRLVNFVVG